MKTFPNLLSSRGLSAVASAVVLLSAAMPLVAQPAVRDRDDVRVPAVPAPARDHDDVRVTVPAVRDRDDVRVTRSADGRAIKNADRNFLEKAARAGMEEVDISRIAAERTQNPDVRRLAQMIVADHDGAHAELAALAAVKGVSLPAKDAEPNRWAKRDAKGFDLDYLDKMVSDHNDTVRLFEKQAKDGEDVEVVAFARKHLPKLQRHQQQAIDLKRLLKP